MMDCASCQQLTTPEVCTLRQLCKPQIDHKSELESYPVSSGIASRGDVGGTVPFHKLFFRDQIGTVLVRVFSKLSIF